MTKRARPPWFRLPPNIASKLRLGKPFKNLGPCWEWTAAKSKGYGRVWHNGRWLRAHRVIYELLVRPVPEALQLDHQCRNRGCGNPRHQKPVTGAVNNARSESASAQNARRTHCRRGHEFTPENTRNRQGSRKERTCRACSQMRDRRRREAADRRAA